MLLQLTLCTAARAVPPRERRIQRDKRYFFIRGVLIFVFIYVANGSYGVFVGVYVCGISAPTSRC